MRATKLLLVLAVVGIIVITAIFLIFPETQPGMVKKQMRSFKGFGPAQTPNEALDKFKNAIKERDYETASVFCTGEYAEFMLKGSKAAQKLGKAIDELVDNLETTGVKSTKARLTLSQLEPFPLDFKVIDVKNVGEDRAVARLGAAVDGKLFGFNSAEELIRNVDNDMLRSLVPLPWDGAVDLVRDGQGDKSWKLSFPVTPRLRTSVDKLVNNYSNYVRALDKVKYEVKHDAATKGDVESRLETELSGAKN